LIEFLVKSSKHSRFFKASSPEVAAKRFLNYLRRYTNERPTSIDVAANVQGVVDRGTRLATIATVDVEWYRGPLDASQFSGAEGEWWRIKRVISPMQEEVSK
jgi:hypothetical protein